MLWCFERTNINFLRFKFASISKPQLWPKKILEAKQGYIVNSFSLIIKRPNRLKFVVPISSHVTILLGSFNIMQLFTFMAQLYMTRNMLEKSQDDLNGCKQTSADLILKITISARKEPITTN